MMSYTCNVGFTNPMMRISKIQRLIALSLSTIVVGCASIDKPTDGRDLQLAIDGPGNGGLPSSADVRVKNPNSGCYDKVRITYRYSNRISVRTGEGGFGSPGDCTTFRVLSDLNGKILQGKNAGPRELESAVGLYSGNKTVDLPRMGENILPVVQGKADTVTYLNLAKSDNLRVTFLSKHQTEDVKMDDGQTYVAKLYNFAVRRSEGRTGSVVINFDALYADNPRDANAPLFLGTKVSGNWAEYPELSTIIATKVEFLQRSPVAENTSTP